MINKIIVKRINFVMYSYLVYNFCVYRMINKDNKSRSILYFTNTYFINYEIINIV